MIPSRLDAESCDNWFLRIILGLDERLTALEAAADWKRKHDAVAAELREKKQLLEKATADYTEQYKRAEAAAAAQKAAADECSTLRTQRDEWRQRAQANQAAADTLERLKGTRDKPAEAVDVDGTGHKWQLVSSRSIVAELTADRDSLLKLIGCDNIHGAYAVVSDLRRDAERWRWVNTKPRWCGFVCDGTQIGINVELWNLKGADGRKGSLEEAVDAAIAAQAAKEDAK